MGISNVTSHLIMFIAVLVVSTVVVSVFNNYVDSTTSAITVQQDWLTNQLKTSINIEVVNYNNNTNKTTIYLENTGATTLDIDYTDVYLGGERIPRNNTNRTIEVINDSEIRNIGKWDPKEEVKIIVNKSLEENKTYKLIVTSQYNGMDTEEFST